MIRKISVQDVVSKRPAKEKTDEQESVRGRNAQERDFLIERLSRKRTETIPTPIKSQPKIQARTPRKNKNSGSWYKGKWFLLSVPIIIAILLVIVLQFLSSTTISITPKHLIVPISATLNASINNLASNNTSSTLMYQIITLTASDSQSASTSMNAIPSKPQKASGQIIVYNKYSSAPQGLVKNTRFQTASGLIYRTTSAVTIPGMKTVGGQITAGSVSVNVVADQTGSKYNVDLSDFTIPGFQSDSARYSKIYARSKTAITGGSDGNSFGISDYDRTAAQSLIEARLSQKLMQQVQAQKTANSVIFADASKISFQQLPDTAGVDTQRAIVNEQGTISSVVFDKQAIAKILLTDSVASVGNNAAISGIESLKFAAAVSTSTPIWQAKPFTFSLLGSVNVVGVVDTDKLLQDVRGVSRSGLPAIFSKYPTIDKVNVEIKPLWQSTVPTDPSKIKVQVLKE